MPIELTRDLAYRAGLDEANRSMRAAGRQSWSEADYARAWQTFNRLWPLCEHHIEPDSYCWKCNENDTAQSTPNL